MGLIPKMQTSIASTLQVSNLDEITQGGWKGKIF